MTLGYGAAIGTELAPPVALEEEGDWETYNAVLKAAVAHAPATVDTLAFSKRWLHFRQRHHGFDASLTVTFDFQLDHCTVRAAVATHHGAQVAETHWQGPIFDAGYRPAYDQAHIHEINHRLATRLYEAIAAKVPAADGLPAGGA